MDHNMNDSSPIISKISEATMKWLLAQVAGGSAIEIRSLKGGISSAVYAVHIQNEGKTLQWVMRQYTDKGWLAVEPDLAVYETEVLRAVWNVEIPSPKWLAADFTGESCGLPTVLMSQLPGAVVLSPSNHRLWLAGLAEALADLHFKASVAKVVLKRNYKTYNRISELQAPEWSRCPDVWNRIIAILQNPNAVPEYELQLIHRDYHPTNVLWEQGKVSGIVDWVNSCMGPVGIDTGHCRLNLVQLYGVQSADEFLHAYLNSGKGSREANNPYWDMLTLIEILPGPPSVYEGWSDLGFLELDSALIIQRLDEYAESLLYKLSQASF